MNYKNNKSKIILDISKIVFPFVIGAMLLKAGLNSIDENKIFVDEEIIVDIENNLKTDDDTIAYLVQMCRVKDKKITNKSFFNGLPDVYKNIINQVVDGNYVMSIEDCNKRHIPRLKQIEIETPLIEYFRYYKTK